MMTYFTAYTILSVFVITSQCQLEKDILEKRIQECFAETKVPEDLQKVDPTGTLDNPKLKCFSACMMKKKGTMKNGKIDPDLQLASMHSDSFDSIKDIVNACSISANQNKDECEIAYSYVKCLLRNISVYQA